MNIREILRERGVSYIESGPNVRKGHINIQCPWCGDADPSQHLGIDPSTGSFSCWRNIEHRGFRPHTLLMKLTGCSHDAAEALLIDVSDLPTVMDRLLASPKQHCIVPTNAEVADPKLHPLTTENAHQRFWSYLEQRGFPHEHIQPLSNLYGLKCAIAGRFNNRIVFPIIIDGYIVGYVGRCVDRGHLRYLSHPGTIVKQNILWFDLLSAGGRRLYICEGPFDALKIDYVSRVNGIPDRATCIFGVNPTQAQLNLIRDLSIGFESVSILFDSDAIQQAMHVQQMISDIHATITLMPSEKKDPGSLSWGQIISMGKMFRVPALV